MSLHEIATGNWLRLKGEIKRRWGKLTDDEITTINGNKEKLVGRLMADYSMAKDEARRQVDQFWMN